MVNSTVHTGFIKNIKKFDNGLGFDLLVGDYFFPCIFYGKEKERKEFKTENKVVIYGSLSFDKQKMVIRVLRIVEDK